MRWAIWDVSDRGPEITIVNGSDPSDAWQAYAGWIPQSLDSEEYRGKTLWRPDGGDAAISDVTTEEQLAELAQDLWVWWRDTWGDDPPHDAAPPDKFWPAGLGPLPPERRP